MLTRNDIQETIRELQERRQLIIVAEYRLEVVKAALQGKKLLGKPPLFAQKKKRNKNNVTAIRPAAPAEVPMVVETETAKIA